MIKETFVDITNLDGNIYVLDLGRKRKRWYKGDYIVIRQTRYATYGEEEYPLYTPVVDMVFEDINHALIEAENKKQTSLGYAYDSPNEISVSEDRRFIFVDVSSIDRAYTEGGVDTSTKHIWIAEAIHPKLREKYAIGKYKNKYPHYRIIHEHWLDWSRSPEEYMKGLQTKRDLGYDYDMYDESDWEFDNDIPVQIDKEGYENQYTTCRLKLDDIDFYPWREGCVDWGDAKDGKGEDELDIYDNLDIDSDIDIELDDSDFDIDKLMKKYKTEENVTIDIIADSVKIKIRKN